jgi:hypothetical protein
MSKESAQNADETSRCPDSNGDLDPKAFDCPGAKTASIKWLVFALP